MPDIAKMKLSFLGAIVLLPMILGGSLGQTSLRFVSWNVDSGGSDPSVIIKQLTDLGRYDVYALQEVDPRQVGQYGDAILQLSKSYRHFESLTGRSGRLMIIYDTDKLDNVNYFELFIPGGYDLNDWPYCSPLGARFRTKDGREFLFVTVQLTRDDAKLRNKYAKELRGWAEEQSLPIVALGDFNFDFDFATQKGNAAFDVLQQGGAWKWVKPPKLIDTNWSDSDGDGVDDYPNSMLDFAFVSRISGSAECHVIVRDGDFPDDEKTSDHRPLDLRVTF